MAELTPILPLLYDPAVVGDLSAVLTPPYDVISKQDQDAYRRSNPYSAIHIELPVAGNGTDAYGRARELLEEWKSTGALREAPSPSLFVHAQEFILDGVPHVRTALLAGVRLEPWDARVVLPHERTFSGPKQDRLQLLRATAVAPSSIFGLYDAPAQVLEALGEVTRGEPLFSAVESEVTHRLWQVSDPRRIEAVVAAMRDRQIYVADGHHRYETALAYRDERRAAGAGPENAAYNYVAMSLVAFQDPGLIVLPTHRLVQGISASAIGGLVEMLGNGFTVAALGVCERTERGVSNALAGDEPYAFLLYTRGALWRVTGDAGLASRLPTDRSEAWQGLDLAALHSLVFGEALGVAPEETEQYVRYTRDVPGAFAQVDSGEAQLAAFVRPTDVGALRAVADAGDKMPQKSTYFYPKFPAGLVINQLDVTLPVIAGVA